MNKEKVLVLGASGMVGSVFVEKYSSELDLLTPRSGELDIRSRRDIERFIANNPDIYGVINLAAYTNVSEGQKQKGDKDADCWSINVVGATNLAEVLANQDIFFIHISTDMVFPGDSGNPGPYDEDHLVTAHENDLTWYGYSKAVAEKNILERMGDCSAIVRIIYPVTKEYDLKSDFLRGPLSYYENRGELYPVFSDQQMNISDIDEMVSMIKVLLDERRAGIFHGGSRDLSTPYELISLLFELVYGNSEMVREGSLAEFLKKAEDPVRYPKYGGLLNERTRDVLRIELSPALEIVKRLYGK